MIDQSTEFGARAARHLREAIVVLSGAAAIDHDAPSADQAGDYRAKYDERIARIGVSPGSFSERYGVPLRIQLERVRGH